MPGPDRRSTTLPSVAGAIGWSPLVDLSRIARGTGGRILAKLEHLNPNGSKKDRIALQIVADAEAGRWLRAAYNGHDTLPDGGTRVLMQVRELSRRLPQREHDGSAERPLQGL